MKTFCEVPDITMFFGGGGRFIKDIIKRNRSYFHLHQGTGYAIRLVCCSFCLCGGVLQSVDLTETSESDSDKGQGLFSPIGRDRQWVHRPSPERVLVKLGTEHLALQ